MFGGPYSQSQNAPNLAESSHLNHFSQPNNNLNSQYKPQNNLKNSFSIAQMAASTQQQQSHNIPGMPSFGPFDPMSKATFIKAILTLYLGKKSFF